MKTSVIEVRDMLSVLSVLGVENRIREVPGVESATVNFAAGTATVRYDETRLEVSDIKSDVRQRGYEGAGESPSRRLSEHPPASNGPSEPSTPEAAPSSAPEPVTAVPKAPAVTPTATPQPARTAVQAAPDLKPSTPSAAEPKTAPAVSVDVPTPAAPAANEQPEEADKGSLGKISDWVRTTFGGEKKDQTAPDAQSPTPAAAEPKGGPGAPADVPAAAAPSPGGHEGHAGHAKPGGSGPAMSAAAKSTPGSAPAAAATQEPAKALQAPT